MKKKEDKIQYELCPRCELNYKPQKQRYCDICNAALRADGDSLLLPEDDDETEKLCPVCRVNYMNPDEELCFMCQKERERGAIEEEESWHDFVDDEEVAPLEELEEISFDELAKEEELNEEEETEEFVSEGDDFEYVDPDGDYGDDEEDEEDDI